MGGVIMFTYVLTGRVLPERATFSMHAEHKLALPQGEVDARISIVLNQVAVTINSPWNWDVFDLRNLVLGHLQVMLAPAGYLLGHAYEVELTRAMSSDNTVDIVYGIDIPILTRKMEGKFSAEAHNELVQKSSGKAGHLLTRCFTDLMLAMKHPIDTAFYCYRSIEALRHHCGATYQITDKNAQWNKFREISGIDRESIDPIRLAADGVRHSEVVPITGEQRGDLLSKTWGIVEAYVNAVPITHPV